MIGQIMGAYRISAVAGEGGMGTVFLAEHTLIGHHAAIKVLEAEYSHRPGGVDRFFNEARAASAIRHPGIVEIYDFGYHTDSAAYIVMEHLNGESYGVTDRIEAGIDLPLTPVRPDKDEFEDSSRHGAMVRLSYSVTPEVSARVEGGTEDRQQIIRNGYQVPSWDEVMRSGFGAGGRIDVGAQLGFANLYYSDDPDHDYPTDGSTFFFALTAAFRTR